MHPGIQALLLTPICPHSLSFRPLIFPDSAVISLCMPQDVRSHAWVSFDGRFRHRLMDGDVLEVRLCLHSIPPSLPPSLPSSFDHSTALPPSLPTTSHPPSLPPSLPPHPLLFLLLLQVSNSEYPLPTMTHQNATADWFRASNKAFNFDMRTRQKALFPFTHLPSLPPSLPPSFRFPTQNTPCQP